jgi:hypothetical protein
LSEVEREIGIVDPKKKSRLKEKSPILERMGLENMPAIT